MFDVRCSIARPDPETCEFELYLPKQPQRRYINGESHRYLGRQYRLKARKGSEDSVKCYRGYFHVTCKGKVTPEKVKELLDHWHSINANLILELTDV